MGLRSRPIDILAFKGRDEENTERKLELGWGGEVCRRRNAVQHDEDSRTNSVSIVRVAWFNILMKEPHPQSDHKLHTDSHND